jgi:hypothetical protein
MYLSFCGSLIIMILIFLAFLPSAAAYSFLYYAIKSQATPQAIASFRESLNFPFDILFSGKQPWIVGLTNGKKNGLLEHVHSTHLGIAKFGRLCFHSLAATCFVFPYLLGSFVQKNLSDGCMMLITAIFMGSALYACWRFGHSLQETVNSV